MARDCSNAGVSVSEIVLLAYAYLLDKARNCVKIEEKAKDAEDIYAMLISKTKWLLWDAVRASKLEHGRKSVRTNNSLDHVVTDDNGNDYSPMDSEAAQVRWSEIRDREELAYKCNLVRRVLDVICEMKKISQTNRLIFKAIVLDEVPCSEVSEKYGVTENNIYQIVSRIKKGLKTDGKRIYEDLYRQAA